MPVTRISTSILRILYGPVTIQERIEHNTNLVSSDVLLNSPYASELRWKCIAKRDAFSDLLTLSSVSMASSLVISRHSRAHTWSGCTGSSWSFVLFLCICIVQMNSVSGEVRLYGRSTGRQKGETREHVSPQIQTCSLPTTRT